MAQKKGTRKQYQLTATIYDKRGRVLSSGQNSYRKTHPLQFKYAQQVGKNQAVFLHAEIAALVKLKKPHNAYRMVIERRGADGKLLPSVPCPICTKAIKESGIQLIEYTK